MSEKMHFLVSNAKTVYAEDDKLFINGKEYREEDGNNFIIEDKAREITREFYKAFLRSRFENLSVLTGAGSSYDIGKTQKGQLRDGLWKAVLTKLTEEAFKNFCEKVLCPWKEYSKTKDIEALLTNAYRASKFLQSKEGIDGYIEKIEEVIRESCTLELPDEAPHIEFTRRITARKLTDPRAKIFTLNYDTLFEQAAIKSKCSVIDGFSYSEPREFSGSNFDFDFVIREGSRVKEEDNYVPNVVHIYKPHGSMDWEKASDGTVVIKKGTKKPVIIYPKDSKYEYSFEQPFFEMMLRFQQEVRKKNALLIVIGFSFYDKHISNIILEALDVNPGLRCLIVTKNIDSDEISKLHKRAKGSHNLVLIEEMFSDFAQYYPYPSTYGVIEGQEKEAQNAK